MNGITSVIELMDIEKTYRIDDSEYPVLKGINLNIDQGEFIALMGPSGNGKSRASFCFVHLSHTRQHTVFDRTDCTNAWRYGDLSIDLQNVRLSMAQAQRPLLDHANS